MATQKTTTLLVMDDLRGDENQNFKFEYDELQVGLSFTSYDAACDYIKNWTDSNKLPLVKRDTSRGNEKKLQVVYCLNALMQLKEGTSLKELEKNVV